MDSASVTTDQVLPSQTSIAARATWHQSLAMRTSLILGIGLVSTLCCILNLDRPVAFYFSEHELPGELNRLVTLSEAFAHGSGVLMILLAMLTIQPERWRSILRVATCAYGAGLIANIIKLILPRLRPREVNLSSMDGWASFEALSNLSWSEAIGSGVSGFQSFPSAHTATAFGLALGLSWYFGRGQSVFFLLAGLAGLQRLTCHAHWPSDLVMGSTLALACCPWLLVNPPAPSNGLRLENS